jgi:hypothetical protein
LGFSAGDEVRGDRGGSGNAKTGPRWHSKTPKTRVRCRPFCRQGLALCRLPLSGSKLESVQAAQAVSWPVLGQIWPGPLPYLRGCLDTGAPI